jgi:APA family basic amino acid/polyamine antiporter
VTRLTVLFVLAVLALVIVAGFTGGTADAGRVDLGGSSPLDWFRAGALLFFAFAGYARIATLGEEVRDPARAIPRAIPIALAITVVVYVLVALSTLVAVGPDVLAQSHAPLATAVEPGSWHDLTPIVRVGAAVASLGVLLSLLAGVSRTAFAMAADGELPRVLGHVHERHAVPDVAELAIGAAALVVVLAGDIRGAIGFSSFCVLSYYAITNAAALRLPREHRRWPPALAVFGLAGCIALALTVPLVSLIAGAAVIAVGLLARVVWASFR